MALIAAQISTQFGAVVMLSIFVWVVSLALATTVVSTAAAFESETGHLLATSLVTFAILAAAVAEHRQEAEKGVSPFTLAAIASRYMGLMWIWSAVSGYFVYGFLLESDSAGSAIMAMFLASVAHLFLAFILDRETVAKVQDLRALKLLEFVVRLFFGMTVTLFGLLFAYRNSSVLGGMNSDAWVAMNLAICTATGLLALSGYLILHETGAPAAKRETPVS